MSFDTSYNYNPLPYNIIDKNDFNNRNGVMPSFQYKKKRIIWLNTAFATSSISSGNQYFEFSFDCPQFQLYNQTKLSVISFTSNEATAKPVIIKLKNLTHDSSTWCSDNEAFPLLFVSHIGVNGLVQNNQISVTLTPQTINNIVIKTNNSFTAKDAGITISTNNGHLIIGLLFEDADLIPDNIVSQYK